LRASQFFKTWAESFVAESVKNVVNGKAALFLGHFRVKQHLQKQVTQFARELLPVSIINSFKDFVGFF
jgi:hypothetical protein